MVAPGEEEGGDNYEGTSNDAADFASVSLTYKVMDGLTLALSNDNHVDSRDLTRFVASYKSGDWGVSALSQSAEETAEGGEEEDGNQIAAFYKMGSWKFKALVGAAEITEEGEEDIDVSQVVLGFDYKLG